VGVRVPNIPTASLRVHPVRSNFHGDQDTGVRTDEQFVFPDGDALLHSPINATSLRNNIRLDAAVH
jgi:hypothetical protein